VKSALQKALLNLDAEALKPIAVDKLIEGKDTDYDVIRQAMTVNEQFFK
jgi:hypothetical protein